MSKISYMALVLLIGVILLAGVNYTIDYVASPGFCSNCHNERDYYSSFEKPPKGSLIESHKVYNLSCIDCHSGAGFRGYVESRQTLAGMAAEYVLLGNVTANTSALRSDCLKCHNLSANRTHDQTRIDPHDNVSSGCEGCHPSHTTTQLGDYFKRNCADCHTLPKLGSNHSPIRCRGCHISHGYIPNCTSCHAPHSRKLTTVNNSDCITCHVSAHAPRREGLYTSEPNLSKELCEECHVKEYNELTMLNNKHNRAFNTCTNCHYMHKAQKSCIQCHTHGAELAQKHPAACTTCHSGGTRKACSNCHTDPHAYRTGLIMTS